MNIYQVMPTVSFGDAVSNDARAISKVISEMGYKTGIYAENIDKRVSGSDIRRIDKLPAVKKDDIIIFNHSTGTDLCYKLKEMNGHKIMIYHNITPPEFFAGYSLTSQKLTQYGYKGTKDLADTIEYVISVSQYNADDLKRMGYKCPMTVRPILIPFSDYDKAPNHQLIDKYSGDGYTNIVFVGRLAPNKKQEDVIAAFAYYKKFINKKSRLILVGSDSSMEAYSRKLKKYAEALMLEDVIFTGQVSFDSILAWYRLADVFLCMSEHEGFCVPLIEAMYFNVPVIAYDSSAISSTLGGSGLLIDSKDPVETAMLIDRLVKDNDLKNEVVKGQNERLKYFSYENVRNMFVSQLGSFIESIK